jgi:hypothetical protein
VALDSGCTDHIAAEVDTPGYELEDSPGSRAGQAFIIGDGGRLPNKGQKRLQLETIDDKKNMIDSIFQIARVARPLMSVGGSATMTTRSLSRRRSRLCGRKPPEMIFVGSIDQMVGYTWLSSC